MKFIVRKAKLSNGTKTDKSTRNHLLSYIPEGSTNYVTIRRLVNWFWIALVGFIGFCLWFFGREDGRHTGRFHRFRFYHIEKKNEILLVVISLVVNYLLITYGRCSLEM